MIENKWQKSPVQTKEISAFREKTTDIDACKVAYFASMSGFSKGKRKETGAVAQVRGYENPRMIDLWADDIEGMMEAGNPEKVLKDRRL
jgi:hypothetical protein